MADKLTQNRLKYLSILANVLPNNVLKSYYLSKCFKVSTAENVRIESKFCDTSRKCELCLVPYVNPTCRINTEHKISKFAAKILKKKSVKTKFQNKYLKNLKKSTQNVNILEIICSNCNTSNKKIIEKPNKISSNKVQVIKKKAKSRKKDKFCGLNPDLVIAVKSSSKVQNASLKKTNLTKKEDTTKLIPKIGIAVSNKKVAAQQKNLTKFKNRLGNALSSKPSSNIGLKSFLKPIK